MVDSIPGMTQPLSWTIVNLSYNMVRRTLGSGVFGMN